MKDRELIVQLLAEMGDGWNSLSKQMTWQFRRGIDEPPKVFVLTTGIKHMLSRAEWVSLRKDVVTCRRRMDYQNKKQREIEKDERRRIYMRSYMRTYRKKTNREKAPDEQQQAE